eukprot:Tbor_TRINITY_DN3387_c0_g1::TRINITY_DN3387_c0_g1_i1::g.23411::m.23411/K12859/TXNL4A, DIB1; U5 snRNP protein, DIM1 family
MVELIRLKSGWDVDRFIVLGRDNVVLIRFSQYGTMPSRVARALGIKRNRIEDSTNSHDRNGNGNDDIIISKETTTTASSALKGDTDVCGTEEANRIAALHHSTQRMDEVLLAVARKTEKFCKVYTVDINEVPNFNQMYNLSDPDMGFAIMFFFKGQHIKIDVGSGDYNRINFNLEVDDLIPVIDDIWQAGQAGKTMCVSTAKKFSHAGVKRTTD